MPVRQTLWEIGNEDRVRQGLSLRVIAVRRGAPPHPMHAARLARSDGDYLKGKMLGMGGRRSGCRLCGRLRGLSRARYGCDQQDECEMSNLLGGHLPSSLPHLAAYRLLDPPPMRLMTAALRSLHLGYGCEPATLMPFPNAGAARTRRAHAQQLRTLSPRGCGQPATPRCPILYRDYSTLMSTFQCSATAFNSLAVRYVTAPCFGLVKFVVFITPSLK